MMRTLLILLALAHAAFAAEPVSVLLKGHDDPIVGFLRQVGESRFFLQSDSEDQSVTYEVNRSAIVSVDGRKDIPVTALGDEMLIQYATVETILPNGDVEVWSQHRGVNTQTPLTHVVFGAKTRELPMYENLEVYDQWGNRLAYVIEQASKDLYHVNITLAVPAGFNEEIVLNQKRIERGTARRDGDLWTYTRNTDFPEDRIYTRKVRLPLGAEFVSASHHRTPWTDVLPLTIYWRRFCPKQTDDLMTVTYRLP